MKVRIIVEWVTSDGLRVRDFEAGKIIQPGEYPSSLVRPITHRKGSRGEEPAQFNFRTRTYHLSRSDSRRRQNGDALLVYIEAGETP